MHYPVLLSWRAWVVRDHGIKCVHNYTSPKPEKSVPVPTLISSVLPVLAAGYPAVRQYSWRQFEEIEWSESHVWPHSGCWRWQGNYDDPKRPYDANFTYNIILGLYSLCPASYKVLKMRTCQTITHVIIITGVSFRSRAYIRCCANVSSRSRKWESTTAIPTTTPTHPSLPTSPAAAVTETATQHICLSQVILLPQNDGRFPGCCCCCWSLLYSSIQFKDLGVQQSSQKWSQLPYFSPPSDSLEVCPSEKDPVPSCQCRSSTVACFCAWSFLQAMWWSIVR